MVCWVLLFAGYLIGRFEGKGGDRSRGFVPSIKEVALRGTFLDIT